MSELQPSELNTPTLIRLEQISVRIDERDILKQIDFALHDHRICFACTVLVSLKASTDNTFTIGMQNTKIIANSAIPCTWNNAATKAKPI